MNCTWPLKLLFSYKRCNFLGFNKGSESKNAGIRNKTLSTQSTWKVHLVLNSSFFVDAMTYSSYLLRWRPNWETILLREPPTSLMSVVNHVRTEYLCVESPEIDSAFKESHRVSTFPFARICTKIYSKSAPLKIHVSGWAMDFRGRKISFHAPLPWCIPFAATPCMRWWQIRCKKIQQMWRGKKNGCCDVHVSSMCTCIYFEM